MILLDYPPVVRTVATKLWEAALTLLVAAMMGLTFGMYFRGHV